MFDSTWLTARRLQSRLVLWTVIILTISVVASSEVRTHWNIHLLEDNLQSRAETLVRSVEESLYLYELATGAVDIFSDNQLRRFFEDQLRRFVDADHTLTQLDIVRASPDGAPSLLVSSAPAAAASLIQAMPGSLSTEIHNIGGARVMVTTEPIKGTDLALVAVSSLQNIDAYEVFNSSLTRMFSAAFILITMGLMYLMYQRILSNRFDELLEGIRLASRGRGARIPDDRSDEIGIIAKTLNGLLAQVQSFNNELQSQVKHATEDLNRRNLALEETTRQLLAMQDQLLKSERMATVGRMAATFAHEIGSPMSSLSAHVQLLLEDRRISVDQRETLLIVRQQIEAVVQIVNELLRSARRGPADFVLTDINQILQAVIRLVEPRLTSQHVTIAVDLTPLPPVRGYPLYLQEAFLNLINNAAESMPSGGRLEVQSWLDDDSLLANVRILDTGPGIDSAMVERVFEQFVTTKEIGQGTGLGLSIVKEIFDSHRGIVKIDSNNGRGTAVHVTLPAESSTVKIYE